MGQTPPEFLFAVKASRYLTHVKRLVDIREGIARFYEPLAPMVDAGKLGPVLWQLPENFHRDDERLDGWLELLDSAPPGRHTIEFRHASWFVPEVFDALRARDVALTIGDHPKRPFQTYEADRRLAVRALPLRSRGRGGNYSESEIDTWARRIAQWRRRRGRIRLLQQRLAGVRAGERQAAVAPPRLDHGLVDGDAESLGELVSIEVLAVALVLARVGEHARSGRPRTS